MVKDPLQRLHRPPGGRRPPVENPCSTPMTARPPTQTMASSSLRTIEPWWGSSQELSQFVSQSCHSSEPPQTTKHNVGNIQCLSWLFSCCLVVFLNLSLSVLILIISDGLKNGSIIIRSYSMKIKLMVLKVETSKVH